VTLKDFEQLAEETDLAKPIVRNRVPELAETVIGNPVAEALIRKNCEVVRTRFWN